MHEAHEHVCREVSSRGAMKLGVVVRDSFPSTDGGLTLSLPTVT
jgi:hypothetical protein